jgi:hypothetical protein
MVLLGTNKERKEQKHVVPLEENILFPGLRLFFRNWTSPREERTEGKGREEKGREGKGREVKGREGNGTSTRKHCLPACLPVCLPACLPASLLACLPGCTSLAGRNFRDAAHGLTLTLESDCPLWQAGPGLSTLGEGVAQNCPQEKDGSGASVPFPEVHPRGRVPPPVHPRAANRSGDVSRLIALALGGS